MLIYQNPSLKIKIYKLDFLGPSTVIALNECLILAYWHS